jgi:SAM-dependent methyltransferase
MVTTKNMTIASDISGCPVCGATESALLVEGRERLLGLPGRFYVRQCTACGLAYTDPQLSDEEQARYYPNRYFAAWRGPSSSDRGAVAWMRARVQAQRLRAVRMGAYSAISALPPGRLLDVGCGSGDLAEAFAGAGWEPFGVDTSAEACRLACARGVSAFCGRLDDVPWEEGTFDAVLFTDSLEHIRAPHVALTLAARLLRRDGLVGVTVPNFGSWQRRLFGTYWFHLDLPRHLQHFDAQTLVAVARTAGLEPIELRTSSMVLGFPASVQYALLGRCVLRRGLLVAQAASLPLYALVRAVDLASGGDRVHLVARRP